MYQVSISMELEEKSCVEFNEQNLPDTDNDHDGNSPVIPSSSDNFVSPNPVKRATRQWAAWTREEEESFFSALRQVGKNFQKITCRVQSKNKDQVRHYYYRLVRRMNKLLGPGLCLDAKNSKDTNAAMLRWWSLLEKYSCKASKLHLKPRRFKIFVEALEHQLIKDRKKNVKKQSSQGENCSSPTSTFPYPNKSSGNDLRAINIVATDGQNVEKAANGKGSSTRRSSNLGITRISNKRESSPTKSTRQRRKTGVVPTAAIKKWEKAAMAGVSLVADAAEHVERTSGETQVNFLDGLTVLSAQAVDCSMEQTDPGTLGHVQANSLIKLKLQLFPIDDNTRKALEMDKHNPHLELTLSTRKKISSVLEHMGRKWGSSSVASGELMLFPFNVQRDNLLACQRWTRDSVATATEVYAMIGSPPIFRLRYGWIVAGELQSAIRAEPTIVPVEKMDEMGKHYSYSSGDQPPEGNSIAAARGQANNNNIEHNLFEPGNLPSAPKINGSMSSKIKNVVDRDLEKTTSLSAGEWADSLTNVSADLLPEAPGDAIANCIEIPGQRSHCVEEIPFTCDSFDAAIAAHISSQYKSSSSRPSPHLSSIWDAEETCDEFTFRKSAAASKLDPYPAMAGDRCATTSSADIDIFQGVPEEAMVEDDQMNECPSEPYGVGNPSKDLNTLMDIYWPESLGPLELDVPSCKYYSEDLILSDSLSGLNRLIASSLDAFQHCPLFGLDDKGPSPAAGTQRSASFAGKIGTGDTAGVRSLQV
ncbi:hypothetical protein RND81_04G062300 [Saponaria officinalis]|uniref:TSL-kinase interacting protein 1 n=1 Tax=Saponaria officinalis TaxID=3572 RepID=A0AAW1LI93_SAPOF